jgi:dGTPase
VEAADDICYRIIDVEDAFKLDRLSFKQGKELLRAILPASSDPYSPDGDDSDTISWLRAKAIGVLTEQACTAFKTYLPQLMAGNFSKSLIDVVPSCHAIAEAYDMVKERVFAWDRIVSAEIAGAQMITDVLERLIFAVESPNLYKNEMLLKIVPHYKDDLPTYTKLLTITDFLAGMTDTYLRRIHRRLTGHAIL